MTDSNFIKQVFRSTISMVCGFDPAIDPLGGIAVNSESAIPVQALIGAALKSLAEGTPIDDGDDLGRELKAAAIEAEKTFVEFYQQDDRQARLQSLWSRLQSATTAEEKAKYVTLIWLPELNIEDDAILAKWALSEVQPNPDPIRPTEVVIQLNALYTLPETLPGNLAPELRQEWEKIQHDPGRKIADYDHPVALFESGKAHELVTCLTELDGDIAFEIEKGVLPQDHRLLVLISVSVTHANIDALCGDWIEQLLRDLHLEHLSCLVLTEQKVGVIQSELFARPLSVFSVFGKYGVHFNALKYSQLLLEAAYGYRAGFKLDTDEGIRSRDLFDATGLTWLQTMCHELWGGTAKDFQDRDVCLGVNEGEYVNASDIEKLGYAGSMRAPDVKPPKSHVGTEIFFNKAFAHGRSTALYNRFDRLEEHVSHPVVKGGGYGITNDGLRKAIPFVYSQVGRAEDQQFYFCGLAGGCRGIFHPNLRIAHYKGSGGAVAKAEQKTVATRFIGDMYRLVIFEAIVGDLGVKEAIDPMPGVFAGQLARAQSLLCLLYRAYAFYHDDKPEPGKQLLVEGLVELGRLRSEIDSGHVHAGMKRERDEWRQFVDMSRSVDRSKARRLFDSFLVK